MLGVVDLPERRNEVWNRWMDWFRMSAGSPVNVNFSLELKTVLGKTNIDRASTSLFDEKYGRWGCDSFISKSDLMGKKSEIMPSDTLTIICTMKICETNSVRGR